MPRTMRMREKWVGLSALCGYMSEEDQATYTNHVVEELRLHLSYAKSKSYGYIVDDIKGMYTCCEVSKKLILDFVEEIECNYGNRPTLMRLLRS